MVLFLSDCFQDFCFLFVCFSFQKFEHDMPWFEFVWLSCLEFIQPLESVGLCLLPLWGSFQPLFLWVLFQYCSFSPFLQDSNDMNVRSFVFVPQVPEALFFFWLFKSISSLLFRFGNFYYTIFLFFWLLFLPVLGLCCCLQAFSSCGEQGLPFVVVRGLLIVVASLVSEHRL